MSFELDIGYNSQPGKKEINEDFCAAMLPAAGQESYGAICAIADGVSSGGKGKEAAQTTVMSLVRDYYGTPDTWDTTVALDRVLSAHNSWLVGINRRRTQDYGLTTLTALVMRGQSYTLAHVGDTRAYLLRGGNTSRLTTDHVVDHPDLRHQLLRAVGADERLMVDYAQGDLQVNDIFILLSDGVHGALHERRLKVFAELGSAQEISDKLVQAAIDLGARDNASAIVVRILGVNEVTLQDENRQSLALPVAAKHKVGDMVDGMLVTAMVADSGINLLYQVRDPASKKLYALKALHPAREHDVQERAMLAHEAWLAKRMQTGRAADHLVKLHDQPPTGSASSFYLLYDWHSGETLQQMLSARTKLGLQQAISAASHTLKALGRLHRQGVIHRDIKPANLHIGTDGVLRVLDLGVALSGREPEATRLLHAGTPSYINPEQFGYSLHGGSHGNSDGAGQSANAQSDLYALGVTLYQMLTGKLPYGEVLPYQTGRYFRDPVAPSRLSPEVPIWLDHIVLKAVARDSKQRFETAEEFALALERGAVRPINAPPVTPLLRRDPAALWKIVCVISVLFNLMLVCWLLFLPK